MVIARFHRVRVFGFLLLIMVVMAVVGGFAYAIFRDGDWSFDLPAVVMLAGIFSSVCAIVIACWDPRAIWIENGVLRFYEGRSDDQLLFLVLRRKVPVDSIAGLSSVEADFPGAVGRCGIYVNVKSGGAYKVMTLPLAEPRAIVMARLREALGFTEAKA